MVKEEVVAAVMETSDRITGKTKSKAKRNNSIVVRTAADFNNVAIGKAAEARTEGGENNGIIKVARAGAKAEAEEEAVVDVSRRTLSRSRKSKNRQRVLPQPKKAKTPSIFR